MKRKSVVSLIAIVAIVTAVIFAGCMESYTKIRDILDDPEGYDGKKVTVAGTAYKEFSGSGFYVWGRTGKITIDTSDFDGKLPQESNNVKVTGIVRHTESHQRDTGGSWLANALTRVREHTEIELESWKYID